MTRTWATRALGDAFDKLAALPGSELTSLLLELMRRHAARRTPSELLAQYQRDRFCTPAVGDLRTAVELDAHLLAAAARFEALDLSPVTPLGATSAIALTDQHRVLSALRATEVVSDPTNVLALECAARLRTSTDPIHLTTTQRVIRAQQVPKLPGYAQHFRIFVLGSAGIEQRAHAFTVDTLLLHIRTMQAALDRLEQHGYAFGARRIDVLATPERAALADRLAGELGTLAVRKPLEHRYYAGLRYMIWVTAPDGTEAPLVDGGTFDWLARLTSNRRAVYVASGAGAQLIQLRFRRP